MVNTTGKSRASPTGVAGIPEAISLSQAVLVQPVQASSKLLGSADVVPLTQKKSVILGDCDEFQLTMLGKQCPTAAQAKQNPLGLQLAVAQFLSTCLL